MNDFSVWKLFSLRFFLNMYSLRNYLLNSFINGQKNPIPIGYIIKVKENKKLKVVMEATLKKIPS